MPQPYIPSIYRTHDSQTPAPATDTVDGLIEAVSTCSTHIQSEPYNPKHWTERADYYLQLNYPELAVGDAYRSKLLFDRADAASNSYISDSKSEKPAVEYGSSDADANEENRGKADAEGELRLKTYSILGQALYDCHCHSECFELWQSLTQQDDDRFPRISRLADAKVNELEKLLARKKEAAESYGGSPQQQRDRLRDGSVYTVQYPWMEDRHLTRSAGLIAQINEELENNDMQPPACRVGRSTLAASEDVDMLGMFATRPIRKGECILIDRTTTAACSTPPPSHCETCFDAPLDNPVHVPCCPANYCSTSCRDRARATNHQALCRVDVTWLRGSARGLTENASPMRALLMLRFLALAAQASPQHPLSHPLIARLQPLANANHLDVFTLHSSIATPLLILQQFGINIFTSPDFDTTTLHTLWTRLANNKAGTFDPEIGFVDEISPLLPLFNHSCAPNVEYRKEAGNSTVRFFALRKVDPGEELWDSYLDVEGLEREERAGRLWPWFGGECGCERCVGEKG